jgi:hypothetical protein
MDCRAESDCRAKSPPIDSRTEKVKEVTNELDVMTNEPVTECKREEEKIDRV